MTRPELSVQLYTLRDYLDDLPTLAHRLAELGFKHVEPHRWVDDPVGVRAALEAAGLSAPSAHARFLEADAPAVFAAAVELGAATVIQPNAPREVWHSPAGVQELADRLNELAAQAAQFDIRIGYHNHAFEFLESNWVADHGAETALDYFASQLSDAVVLQVDTYWAAVGGADPVALVERLGNRVALLHIKDGPITDDASEQVAVGNGSMPIAEILAAAPYARPVIELDDFRGDAFNAVEDSYQFLRGRL